MTRLTAVALVVNVFAWGHALTSGTAWLNSPFLVAGSALTVLSIVMYHRWRTP